MRGDTAHIEKYRRLSPRTAHHATDPTVGDNVRCRPSGDDDRTTLAGPIPLILGGDHSIALSDARGVAHVHGFGRVSMVHYDAHADTGDTYLGSLYGHGQPMRRLIESGALRGDRFLQIGLRGY